MGIYFFEADKDQFYTINNALFTPGSAYSISVFIKPTSYTGYPAIISCADSSVSDERMVFFIDQANEKLGYLENAGATTEIVYTTTTVSLNVWQHACFVRESNGDKSIWLDGASKGIDSGSAGSTGWDRTRIARSARLAAGLQYAGTLAHLAVWNKALTDDDVALLSSRINPLNTLRDNLIFYSKMDGNGPVNVRIRDIIGNNKFETVASVSPIRTESPIIQCLPILY